MTALQRRATDTRPIFCACVCVCIPARAQASVSQNSPLLPFPFLFSFFSSSHLPPLLLHLVSERRVDRRELLRQLFFPPRRASLPSPNPRLPPAENHVVDQHKDGLFCQGHLGPARHQRRGRIYHGRRGGHRGLGECVHDGQELGSLGAESPRRRPGSAAQESLLRQR